jgi:hypothetical protein
MDRIKVLEAAYERGHFVGDDADALGGTAGVLKVDWDAKVRDGFPRLEIEVAKDEAPHLISQAQEIGLWVEVVEERDKRVLLKLTIPPVE